jgi:N-acetylglucosaminyldiphosphoundecaprenol N-acetyl-beta-D-mannosaminyltransferase
MPTDTRKNVLGIRIDAVDYDAAVQRIVTAARERHPLPVSALAVHGVMTGALDPEHKYRLNRFGLIVPDGQPVRWMLNLYHRANLHDRVYGPKLTLRICAAAEKEGLPVFFYGGTPEILTALKANLHQQFPAIKIAGTAPSRFRQLTNEEKFAVADRIRLSGARIVFVGLGCPRQEIWAYEYADLLPMPLIAVGAAFPFIAGTLPQAPGWMQDHGLEWLYRLLSEPRRLWKRYLLLNPAYAILALLQATHMKVFSEEGRKPTQELLYG